MDVETIKLFAEYGVVFAGFIILFWQQVKITPNIAKNVEKQSAVLDSMNSTQREMLELIKDLRTSLLQEAEKKSLSLLNLEKSQQELCQKLACISAVQHDYEQFKGILMTMGCGSLECPVRKALDTKR